MRRNWTIGLCLTLILIGGITLASAQTPAAPATPSAPPATPAPSEPAKPAPEATPAAPQSQMQKAPDPQAPGTQTERIVEHDRTFLGVDPTIAMIIGAVLLIVIVFAMVAMGRRRDEIEHTHYNQPRI